MKNDLVILGLIPARGGSKGVPNKNIRNLAGRPLITHTIQAAAESVRITDWFVTTDSETIADVARKAGARVPFMRPSELATDDAAMIDVIRHAIHAYENETKRDVDLVVILQPTCPLRTGQDIDDALELFLNHDGPAETLITIVPVESAHPYYMYVHDGLLGRPLFSEARSIFNRQEFPKIYIREGSIYVATRNAAMNGTRIFEERPLVFEMPPERAANIDTPMDFKFAEFLMTRQLRKRGSTRANPATVNNGGGDLKDSS